MCPLPFSSQRRGLAPGGDPLDRAPLLALVEPDLRRRARKCLNRRHIAAGTAAYRQREPADALYLIDSGRFRVFPGERAGHERVQRFLGPGEILGEAAFMADEAHITNAVAVDDSAVWRLARADFDSLLGKHTGILRYLAALLGTHEQRRYPGGDPAGRACQH